MAQARTTGVRYVTMAVASFGRMMAEFHFRSRRSSGVLRAHRHVAPACCLLLALGRTLLAP